MKLKVIALSAAVALILLVAIFIALMRGPDLSQYRNLIEPRFTEMPSQKMIEVESSGDPNVVAGKALGLLFKTYFSIRGGPKGSHQPAPRARWSKALDSPKSQWVGRYGIPVPNEVTALPPVKSGEGLTPELVTWEYGPVAEILHVGPYTAEAPTISRLKKFIVESGFEVIGEHEEEYLKGPGMFFKGNPEKYYTIIRYRIRRSAAQGASPE